MTLSLVELPAGVRSELMGLEEDFRDSGGLRATMDIPNVHMGGYQGHNSILPGTVLYATSFTGQKRTLLSFSKA